MTTAMFLQTTQTILNEEFSVFLRRIQARADDHRVFAAEAILSKNDRKAQDDLVISRQLEEAKNALGRQVLVGSIQCTKVPQESLSKSQTDWRYGGLGVTYLDRRIQRETDAATFADVIQEIGCEKISALNLRMNYLPLVGRQLHRLAHQRYQMQIEKRGEWFIVTHSSAARKKALLDRIKNLLELDLVAELV